MASHHDDGVSSEAYPPHEATPPPAYADEKEATDHYFEKEGDYENVEAVVDEDDSPIEEVRAVVPNTDDPNTPVVTFRMVLLGPAFTAGLAFVNQFFWFRNNPFLLTALVVQLLTYPLGKAMERAIPKSRFFNPGPFNMKEHALIVAMVNSCYQTAYSIDVITIQRVWYKQDLGWGGGLLLTLTTQFMGYGIAGFLRPYLVYPASMVWPSNLVNVALLRSFHGKKEEPGRGMMRFSRIHFFLIAFACQFVYYWLPGYFMTILTAFSWICWINPNNIVLSQLTGGYAGLGMGALAFDWNTIVGYLLSPLIVPWWAIANIAVGFVFIAWVLAPALYYTNTWDAKAFPIITNGLFQTNGSAYNIHAVLTPDLILNETAYEEYGPLRLSAFFAITYGIGFAGLTSVLTHTYLYHGKEILAQWRRARDHNEDVHMKLMRAYKEVPNWWYYIVFILSIALAFVTIYVWPIYLPWWGIFLSVGLTAIFVLPIGIITAITNQTPGLNVLTEFIIGYALPGHPIANVTFKTYGYISMVQAITFVQDLKLGHYCKVPPRPMFFAQVAGTFIAAIVNLATARWLMDTVPGICTPDGYPFTCPSAHTFYSASVIWGAIGPQKVFSAPSPYSPTLWFFLIGAILPIPFYFLGRRFPNSLFRYVHIPLIFNATGMMPPAVPLNFSMWCGIGFVFMYYIRKYHNAWWHKYNYVFSASQDSGVAIAALVIFIVSQTTGYSADWWGKNATVDNCPNSAVNYYGM
ncbi:hypothetical protein BZG36_00958 [Bifiguratus adelaidae]|uniref:OPT family small oligopeptide transporter n=1 Tax=Bifiguratus adelaidae TaxID=1938954 RepID=A0A261Y6G6_9FUNG|nr:hypothetical protein BZG36_00958 [Bifiguratus adelaidae]